jgi:hypothetical protein
MKRQISGFSILLAYSPVLQQFLTSKTPEISLYLDPRAQFQNAICG